MPSFGNLGVCPLRREERVFRHAASKEAHPELYRDGAGPDVMTAADWQASYPLLNMEHRGEPTRYDLGLPAGREAARDDPELELG